MALEISSQVFNLRSYGNKESVGILIAPPDIPLEKVTSAWAYAVRYTAKGLDLPDYDAAIAILIKRHPSWIVVRSQIQIINLDLTKADNDQPDA